MTAQPNAFPGRHTGNRDDNAPADGISVRAPDGALAWSETYGWVEDHIALADVRTGGDLVLPVIDGYVRDVTGVASTAAVIRTALDLRELQVRLDRFTNDLIDTAEGFHNRT